MRPQRGRLRGTDGQATILLVAAVFVLFLGVAAMAGFGRGMLAKSRHQRAVDLGAISGARYMRDNFGRLFEPAVTWAGLPNSRHLSKAAYVDGARAVATRYAARNGVASSGVTVEFPDGASFAPVRIRVKVRGEANVGVPVGGRSDARVPVPAAGEAELVVSGGLDAGLASMATGGGYNGPLASRQGKPMRPDVAAAFDRMYAAARAQGVTLTVVSGYRSDAEQAKLFAAHPDPKWVARPGTSLHRMGTELDLGPSSAYGWLAANAGKFGFTKRYSWEPWHFGYTLNQRSTPDSVRGRTPGDGRSAVPTFVPQRFVEPITRAAMRWNVSAALLSAQLYAESNFNPFSVSSVGARGIAQFMPGTARTYGLSNPFDPVASIEAQAHLMRDLLRQLGSVPLALAAYNAGAGAVQRYGGIPPYPETRAYVARILALMGGAGAGIAPELEVRLAD